MDFEGAAALSILSILVFQLTAVETQPTLSPASRITLQFVAVVTRHGSRSPLATFPNDPYPYTDRQFWPDGPNELTNLGKVQLYHTGEYIRRRYTGFLNPNYYPNDTDVEYNHYTRDYMSAACLTAGMYPPVPPQVWNPSLRWQPIPQSLRPFDICDLTFDNTCPKFMSLFEIENQKFNDDSGKYKDLLEYVSENAGTNYTQLSKMYDVYDTLLMQAQNGFKLPQWTKKVFPFTLRPIAVSFLVQTYAGNEDLIKLGAGPELKYICDMMVNKVNGTMERNKKFYIEAAHDCTLISLFKAFGNNDPDLEIRTGAYAIFELHKINSDYIVQVFYFRTSYDQSPDLINIKGCPNPCSLGNFVKFVDSINPPDWKQACQL